MSVRAAMDLAGRKAIVTGGSRGLGLQIAEALGEMGAELVLAARRQDELDQVEDVDDGVVCAFAAVCCSALEDMASPR